jgi:hypothetical protein
MGIYGLNMLGGLQITFSIEPVSTNIPPRQYFLLLNNLAIRGFSSLFDCFSGWMLKK